MSFFMTSRRVLLLKFLVVIIAIILVSTITISYFYDTKFILISTIINCIIILCGLTYGIINIKRRFIFFMFNFTFFLFLLGGHVITMLKGGRDSYFPFSLPTTNHTLLCLFISILTINTIYIINNINTKRDENYSEESSDSTRLHYIRFISLIILLISLICRITIEMETTIYLLNTSYRDYYTSFSSSLPSILQYLSSVFYISCFIYLATFPSKRSTLFVIGSLILVAGIILISGERGEPLSLISAIIFYIFIRNKHGLFDIVITRKIMLVTLILVPFLMFMLQMISYSRNNVEVNIGLTEGIEEFFISQASSSYVIGYGKDLHENINQLSESGNYTFGHIEHYLQQNLISRVIFGYEQIKLNSIEMATSGNSYGSAMAYLRFPKSYLNGVGNGTTFIAELYNDFGYIGIIIGSAFISLLINRVEKNRRYNWLIIAISLSIARYIFLLPRGAFFSWLTQTFAFQNVLLVVFIVIATDILSGKKNKISK